MQNPATLIIEAPSALALKDTQTDEYYEDVMFEGVTSEESFAGLKDGDLAKEKKESDKEAAVDKLTVFQNALKILKANPYPGLRPFKTFEANVFFGRKEITFDLIKRLANHRFIAVLGASGTGKSSLVRAGLLPGLKTLPGKQGLWKIVICRPGKNPFGNLARALKKAGIASSYTEAETWSLLSSSSYGFEELYNSIDTPKRFNTLIAIDQFEELFRYSKDYGASSRNDAALFVKMLIDISKITALNTYVMITMRSEYLGDCVKFTDLAEVINEGQFLVPRLKFKQLRDAIIEPASFSGASVDEAFADKLIGEIGDNMDQLPVLQHALRRSYEEAKQKINERGGIKVLYQDYKESGLMQNALDKHANEIYSALNENQKRYCKKLFQCITDRSSDGRGIRRPMPFLSILKICEESSLDNANKDQIRSELTGVIDCFRQESVNFLMPPPHVQLTDETEIDISHESLMRIWKDLHHWIEEEANDAILLDELLQRDPNEYIKGSRLVIYKEWVKRKDPKINWALLYKPSATTRENYQQKFDEAIILIEKSIKREKFRMITVVGIPAIILLILAAAFMAFYKYGKEVKLRIELQNTAEQLNTANRQKDSTNSQLTNTLSKVDAQNIVLKRQGEDLTQKRDSLIDQQNKLSIKQYELFISNKKLSEKNSTISRLVDDLKKENKQKESALSLLKIKEDSLKTASASATNLRNLALAIRHAEKSLSIPVRDLKREEIKAHLALVAYQLYRESGQEDSNKLQSQVYSALYSGLQNMINSDTSYKDAWQITPYQNTSDHFANGAIINNKTIYLTAEDKTLYSFDLENKKKNEPAYQLAGNKLMSVEAGTKSWLTANTLSKKLLLINNSNRNENTVLSLPGIVRTSKFSPDGSIVYVYSRDTLYMITVPGKKIISKEKINFKIEDIAISDSKIYALANTGDVVIWNRNKISLMDPVIITSPVKGMPARATTINCKPDNSLIVWGNEKGEVFYLKDDLTKKPQYLTKFSGPVTSIAFNFSYNLLAIASYDKSIQVFSLPNLQSDVPLILNNNEGPVSSIFFQKNRDKEENLVSVIGTGIIRIYPMSLTSLAGRVSNFYKNRPPEVEDLDMYIDKEARK